ncbi:MAG: hypothetical protein CBE49_002825 [Rickettsiales bacterium TMED289]|nr:MAG: hypothetical protein CBE49_002825 [Rickettsiales bacterium TMED289]|tara:strand:- start:12736 stop:16674 length:3939 start_codon:yes stop_codon:yes gene_type:complete
MKKTKVLIKKVEFDFNINQKEYDSVIFSFLSRITKYDFDNIFNNILSKKEFQNFIEDIYIEKLEIDLNDIFLSDFQNLSKIIESHIEMELLNYINFNKSKIVSKSVDDFLDEYFSQKILPWWFDPNDNFKNILQNKKLDIRDNKKVYQLIVKDYNFFKKIFNHFSEDEINILLKDILGDKFKIYKNILDFKKNIYNIIPDFKSVDSNLKLMIFSSIKDAHFTKDYNLISEQIIRSEILSKDYRLDLILKNYDRYLELTDFCLEFTRNNTDFSEKINNKPNYYDTKKSIKNNLKKKYNGISSKYNSETTLKFKKILFDSVSEYFKIFEFYKSNLHSKESELIFETDYVKFSKKFKNEKDLISKLLIDEKLFNEYISNYKSVDKKLISFSAATLSSRYNDLADDFLAKFSPLIKDSESTFFEFQKRMNFNLPDDFVKLFIRHNIIKSIALDPNFKFNKSNLYYGLLFQIISSGDLKNLIPLKKQLLVKTKDSELADVISVINKPYPFEKVPQLTRDSIFFKDFYFHFLNGDELISWSNIEVVSEREVIAFFKVLIKKNDIDFLKIIFTSVEFLESKLEDLIDFDFEFIIKLFHLLNNNKINLNDYLSLKPLNDKTINTLILLEIFKNKLWRLISLNSINFEIHKLISKLGFNISELKELPKVSSIPPESPKRSTILPKSSKRGIISPELTKRSNILPEFSKEIIKTPSYFAEIAEKSISNFVFEFFQYAEHNTFLKHNKIDFLIRKIKHYFKTNKNQLSYYLEIFKFFTKNQLIIFKIFEYEEIVSIFQLKFKKKVDKSLLKNVFHIAYKPSVKNYLKLIDTLSYLNENNQISKFEIIHLIFLQEKFSSIHFNKLFKQVIVDKINFSDLILNDTKKFKSASEINFKKNQILLLEKIIKKENKHFSLSKKSIQNISMYKDSLTKNLEENNFKIFTYYVEFGSFSYDSKIYTLKRLKEFFDSTQSKNLITVKKYLYRWSKSKSKIDRFLNVIFINSKEESMSVKEFGNLLRLIYPNLYKYIDLLTRTFGQIDLLIDDSVLNFKSKNIYNFNETQFELKKLILKKFLLSWSQYVFIIKDPIEFLAETLFSDIVRSDIWKKEDSIISKINNIKLSKRDKLIVSNFANKINLKIHNTILEKTTKSYQNIDEIKEGVIIYNAGLLLFWPFLKTLFLKLNLLTSSKKSYKDEVSMDKAVLATDFLVNGTNSKEKDFIFNKVLCGVDINKEIDIDLLLSDFEIEICKNAIQALLSNWTKVKSVQTLRDWFLNREGRLIEKEDSFVIDIENKPPDIFLKSIPWGISVVNYDLMEKKLIVNWKH